jgi:hypothetical protein
LEQESVSDPTPSPDPVPQPPGSPDYNQQGMTTGEKPTDYSKAQLSWLQSIDTPGKDGFINGFLSGYDALGLQNMFKGTNINYLQVNSLINTSEKYYELNRFYTQEWSRLTEYYSPIRSSLISQMESAIAAKDIGGFYRALNEIDRTWAITDPYMRSAEQASSAWSQTIGVLGNYIRSGRVNPMDPFNVEDPTVAADKKVSEEREREISNLIDQLKKASSDSQKAALISQLKGYGIAAIALGIFAIGLAALFIPAVNMALGPTIVGILSGMFKIVKNVGDDALKGIGAVDDVGAAGLGRISGQLADDAANVVNKLLKGSGGEAGGQGRTLANQIQRAADNGDAELVRKLIQAAEKYLYNSYQPQGQILSESHKRILREIKKPYELPEVPRQKYKMNFKGKFSPQNTPDKTASKQTDDSVKAQNAAGQTWRTSDRYWKGYETVERMNIIYDNIGHGSQYWDMIVNENQNKKGWRDREVQEQLNIIAHEKAMSRENPLYESPFQKALDEQETMQYDNDPLFKKVSKRLRKEIDYNKKPSKSGYPDNPPPEQQNGWHPEYGQRDAYYNRLDPQSANAMPNTGNEKIDAKIEKARKVKKGSPAKAIPPEGS